MRSSVFEPGLSKESLQATQNLYEKLSELKRIDEIQSKVKLTFQELFMALFPSILFILLYLLCLRRVCFINICIKQSSRGKNSRKTRLKINDSSSLQFSNKKLSNAWFNLTCYHPPPPLVNPQDNPVGQRLRLLDALLSRGQEEVQIKSNFSLILQSMCYFFCSLHETAELETMYFQGKMQEFVGVVGEE